MPSRSASQRELQAGSTPATPEVGADSQSLPGDGRRMIEQLTTEMLPTLIARLGRSGLGELEVRENGWHVRLRRPSVANGNASAAVAREPANRGDTGAAPRTAGATAGQGTDSRGRSRRPAHGNGGLVKSVAVGYFLLREGIDVGTHVQEGDLIGHVDVLGVRQEVVAGIDGTVRELVAESGQAVEYGQPIARIEPETGG